MCYVAGATAVKAVVSEINSNLTAQHFYLARNPEHCEYDFSNCYRIGNIAVLSLYLSIKNIPAVHVGVDIATLPFKVKNAFPLRTVLNSGERAIMYLGNNDNTGVLSLHAYDIVIDSSEFLGQIVAIVE